jgi:hypothetical protein
MKNCFIDSFPIIYFFMKKKTENRTAAITKGK